MTCRRLNRTETPSAPLRWVNEWDNLDGTIERGYGGRSIFWDNHVVPDLTRVGEYGRLLASLGINGCSINNVNANPRVLTPEFLPQLARIAEAFRPWGVRLALVGRFRQPEEHRRPRHVRSARSARRRVVEERRVDELYRAIPDLGGFVLKADSEGRVGPVGLRPHARRRRQRDRPRAGAARRPVLLSRLRLRPPHGLAQPRRTTARAPPTTTSTARRQVRRQRHHADQARPDRFPGARAGSPLFGASRKPTRRSSCRSRRNTSASSATSCSSCRCGKRRSTSTCRRDGSGTPVKAAGGAARRSSRPTGGFVGVSNVGLDDTGSAIDLAQANLYGFGRLAWNPDLTARADRRRMDAADLRQATRRSSRPSADLNSRPGAPTRTTPARSACRRSPTSWASLRPGVEASERQRLGPVASRRRKGRRHGPHGRDRHRLHRPIPRRRWQRCTSRSRHCPDDLLLFMHHVPYTLQAALRQDGHPAHLRFALRGRGRSRRLRATLEVAAGASSTTSATPRSLAQLEYQAGHAMSGATPSTTSS